MRCACAVLAVALAGVPAQAAEPGARAHLGAHAGVALPQLFSDLGPALSVAIDAGARLGTSRLWLFADAGTQQPVAAGSVDDPGVATGTYHFTTRQRQTTVSAGVLWRPMGPAADIGLVLAGGPRLYALETVTDGHAGGERFPRRREASLQLGGVVKAGLEARLVSGALAVEIELAGADLPHRTTGDTSTGALTLRLGYRLFY